MRDYVPSDDEKRVIAWLHVPSWGELSLLWRLRFAFLALFKPHALVNICALTLAGSIVRGEHIKVLERKGANHADH